MKTISLMKSNDKTWQMFLKVFKNEDGFEKKNMKSILHFIRYIIKQFIDI